MKRLAFFLVLAACNSRTPKTESCGSCHVAETAQWSASFHRVAFTDATFQKSLALEPAKNRAFCTGCHAPDGEADGVGCASCHGARPHEAKVAADGTTVCARCHEFDFGDRADLLQKTMSEHAANATAAEPCTSCHMGAGSHAFRAGHDLAWLKGSVRVDVARVSEHDVSVQIHPWTGHDFPTGDMFRRAELLVLGEDQNGAVVASAERIFGRRWGNRNGVRVEVADTRIHGDYREDLHLDAASPIAKVRWTLRFQRVLSQRGEDDVTLVSNDVIAEGSL